MTRKGTTVRTCRRTGVEKGWKNRDRERDKYTDMEKDEDGEIDGRSYRDTDRVTGNDLKRNKNIYNDGYNECNRGSVIDKENGRK